MLRLIRAAVVADAHHVHAPGAVLLEERTIIAAGSPASIGVPEAARVEDRPDAVLLPALVNAHAHLDLTHVGPLPYDAVAGFTGWVDRIRQQRVTSDAAIIASVDRGLDLVRRGGTAMIGDIAGAATTAPLRTLVASGLEGVSYREFFGIGGASADQAVARITAMQAEADAVRDASAGRVRLGVSPHAPYSCAPSVYAAALATGLPVATHLAENLEEIDFVARATGPFADFLRRVGVWDDSIGPVATHPVPFLIDRLAESIDDVPGPVAAVHLNYVHEQHVSALASAGVRAVFCPRASAYFDHPMCGPPEGGPHRYRQMLDAGADVALGTDSIVCLDRADRLSVLDEMRLLARRDGVDARVLLRMATVHGAAALGADPDRVTFRAGPTAGIIAVPAPDGAGDGAALLARAILDAGPIEWMTTP